MTSLSSSHSSETTSEFPFEHIINHISSRENSHNTIESLYNAENISVDIYNHIQYFDSIREKRAMYARLVRMSTMFVGWINTLEWTTIATQLSSLAIGAQGWGIFVVSLSHTLTAGFRYLLRLEKRRGHYMTQLESFTQLVRIVDGYRILVKDNTITRTEMSDRVSTLDSECYDSIHDEDIILDKHLMKMMGSFYNVEFVDINY